MLKKITILMLYATLLFSQHTHAAVVNLPQLTFAITQQDEAVVSRVLRATTFSLVGAFLACSGISSINKTYNNKKDTDSNNFSSLIRRYSFGTAQFVGGCFLMYHSTRSVQL